MLFVLVVTNIFSKINLPIHKVRPNKWLIKSGHDFRELNFIETIVDQQTKPVKLIVNRIEKYEINSQYSPKPEILALIDEYLSI